MQGRRPRVRQLLLDRMVRSHCRYYLFIFYYVQSVLISGQVPGDWQQGGPGWAGEGVCVQTPLGGRQGGASHLLTA